jgi:hypothetical protein
MAKLSAITLNKFCISTTSISQLKKRTANGYEFQSPSLTVSQNKLSKSVTEPGNMTPSLKLVKNCATAVGFAAFVKIRVMRLEILLSRVIDAKKRKLDLEKEERHFDKMVLP